MQGTLILIPLVCNVYLHERDINRNLVILCVQVLRNEVGLYLGTLNLSPTQSYKLSYLWLTYLRILLGNFSEFI